MHAHFSVQLNFFIPHVKTNGQLDPMHKLWQRYGRSGSFLTGAGLS